MDTIEKSIRNEITKWARFEMDIYIINNNIRTYYYKISSGDYDSKKEYFIKLHYLKMKRDYILLKIYHENIKKNLYNEKLLNYYKSILIKENLLAQEDLILLLL